MSPDNECVTDAQIEILNQARDALKEIADACIHASWDAETRPSPEAASVADYGRVAGIARVAADLLFDLLNTARSHRVRRDISDDVLHNRKAELAA